MKEFDFLMLEKDDRLKVDHILKGQLLPTKTIQQDGKIYLVRWELVKTPQTNVWLHIQVGDDPMPHLHTHPWDNCSVYIAGMVREDLWEEVYRPEPGVSRNYIVLDRVPTNVVFRAAGWAHSLKLLTPYCITMFTTGPAYRNRGYWLPGAMPPNTMLRP